MRNTADATAGVIASNIADQQHDALLSVGPAKRVRLSPKKLAPDIVFALIGSSGCDLDAVTDAIEAELRVVNYSLRPPIRLSELLTGLQLDKDKPHPKDEAERISRLQDIGDRVRRECGDASAVAALGVLEVSRQRVIARVGKRTAFLMRSLKHPEEVNMLREVYGNNLIVVSVYEPKDVRVKALTRRIEKSRGTSDCASKDALDIIDRDEHGKEDGYSQDVRGAFPKADFFVRFGEGLRKQTARLVEVLFGHPFRTPTHDEKGMFLARAAALLSADLSRQVGAVIFDCQNNEIASGCNEVPQFGGGIYSEGDLEDHRDFKTGADPNALVKRDIVEEVVRVLNQKGIDSISRKQMAEALEGSRVASLVEFGRIVHAEMNAIVCAARRGVPVQRGRMYCTTFPCHVCARHIIAAGLSEVVFIEPYPKSMALELYPEAIEVGEGSSERRLRFRPFIGVAPRRYMDLFNYRARKDSDGFAIAWKPKVAVPVGTTNLTEHKLNEQVLAGNLVDVLVLLGWIDETEPKRGVDAKAKAAGGRKAEPRGEE